MSKTNDLIFPLKKQWFDMIASGEKKEEYREITPYWCNRLIDVGVLRIVYLDDETLEFMVNVNNPKIRIGTGRTEWGAEEGKKYFVITWEEKK